MPHGDGIWLIKEKVSNFGKMPPVILLTGYTEITQADAKRLGAYDLL